MPWCWRDAWVLGERCELNYDGHISASPVLIAHHKVLAGGSDRGGRVWSASRAEFIANSQLSEFDRPLSVDIDGIPRALIVNCAGDFWKSFHCPTSLLRPEGFRIDKKTATSAVHESTRAHSTLELSHARFCFVALA